MSPSNNAAVGIEMPRYRCHKEVWALKIKDIVLQTAEGFTTGGMEPAGALIYPEDGRYAPFSVDQGYIDKHQPVVGGYYVVYKGGYKSFSPAEAFEDGYSLIEN